MIIPHGSTDDFSHAGDEDVSGFGDSGIVWIRLHVEGFDGAREVR
jgi:hypothetical protein